ILPRFAFRARGVIAPISRGIAPKLDYFVNAPPFYLDHFALVCARGFPNSLMFLINLYGDFLAPNSNCSLGHVPSPLAKVISQFRAVGDPGCDVRYWPKANMG